MGRTTVGRKAGFLGVLFLVILIVSMGVVQGHGDQDNHTEGSVEPSSPKKNLRPDTIASDSVTADSAVGTEGDTAPVGNDSRNGWFEFLFPGLSGVPDLHPMFVHFPIAFLWAALFFSLVSWIRSPTFFGRLARWMLYLSLVSLPLTAASGFWAVGGWGGGHNATHRNLMLITTALAFALWGLLRLVRGRDQLYRIVLTVGLLVVTFVMTLGADRGAWLVYVEGAGVQSEGHVHKKAP